MVYSTMTSVSWGAINVEVIILKSRADENLYFGVRLFIYLFIASEGQGEYLLTNAVLSISVHVDSVQ